MAYSSLIAHEFASSVRLFMHPTVNNGKYGFQLIPGGHHSPWHAATITHEGGYYTIHKKDADNLRLIYKNNQPYNYED